MLILWRCKVQRFIRYLTVKSRSGWNFTPRVIFTVKSFIDFQTLHRHKINTTTPSNMKTFGKTKVWVLNPNLASKISYERILNNFQNEAVH